MSAPSKPGNLEVEDRETSSHPARNPLPSRPAGSLRFIGLNTPGGLGQHFVTASVPLELNFGVTGRLVQSGTTALADVNRDSPATVARDATTSSVSS